MDTKELTERVCNSAKSLHALYFNINCSPDGFRLAVEALADDADKLLAALASDAAGAPIWRPIETVPKDGTEVALLFASEVEILGQTCPRVRAASWRIDWTIPYRRDNPPTHWSPLPIAPNDAPVAPAAGALSSEALANPDFSSLAVVFDDRAAFELKMFEASLSELVEQSRSWEKAYHDPAVLYEALDSYKTAVEEGVRHIINGYSAQIQRERATLQQLHTAVNRAAPTPTVAADAAAPSDWRELCRRLYVELHHCDQQMRSTRDEDGEPHWTQSAVVRDVLREAKEALDAAPVAPTAGTPIPDSPAYALRGLYKPATEYFIDGKPYTPDEYIQWQAGIIESITKAKLPDPMYYGGQEEDGEQHDTKCAYVDGWNNCRARILAAAPTVAPAAVAPKDDRETAQLADWLLTDPQTGEKLHFAGPLEPDFLRFSRVKLQSSSGAVWTLSARLEEGYLTAEQRLANIKRAAQEAANDGSSD